MDVETPEALTAIRDDMVAMEERLRSQMREIAGALRGEMRETAGTLWGEIIRARMLTEDCATMSTGR